MPRRINLPEWRDKRLEQGAVEIETDDGQVFTIPPPELWPDAVHAARGLVANATAILGEERYAAFVAAGGNAAMINEIVGEMLGASPGESPAS